MRKIRILSFILLVLVFSVTTMVGISCYADAAFDYTIDSIKIKSLEGAELDKVPNSDFALEVVVSVSENPQSSQKLFFTIYGESNLLDVKFADNPVYNDGKLIFTAKVPAQKEDVRLIKAFIWGKELSLVTEAGSMEIPADEEPQVSANGLSVIGISFEQRGMYIKMTLEKPTDETNVANYEAIIWSKENPEISVHRSIKADEGTAHYRLDNDDSIVSDVEYNAIKVITNGNDGPGIGEWVSDISIFAVNKEIAIAEAVQVRTDKMNIALDGIDKGFICATYTREDETVIGEEHYNQYEGKSAGFYNVYEKWSDDDKKALQNGEVYVSVTGINITKNEPVNGKWVVKFEKIKAPRVKVRCDVDIIQ